MKPSLFTKILRAKKLLLPPLSGYTDYPFRVILARFHPSFITTEMANARAIVQGNRRTSQILQQAPGSHYNGVQLIGSNPEYMGKAAQIVASQGFDYIDINMGCTARKVTRRGEGIALMKQEKLACELVAAISHVVEIPVTCKLRLGISKQSINILPLSQQLVDAGATALTIHGRSGEKKFGLPVDVHHIKQVAQTLSVPVIANGGIYTGADAQRAIQETTAAAVMPGRGIIGNPWIVPEISSEFSHRCYHPPTLEERKTICLDHLCLLKEVYGERRTVVKMRSILPHYFSSCCFLKELKKDVHQATSNKDLRQLLGRIQENETTFIYYQYQDR
jgi:tRNA-dihydrouridine synthase B